MSFFDKMFKKNKLDETMEKVYEDFAENNPITRKAKATIEEAAERMTHDLEVEAYGKAKDHSDDHRTALEDFDSISADWDTMIDQIVDNELGKYKICPKCKEAVPSELDTCPHCGATLPDLTAAYHICPKCGAKNKYLNLKCTECGAPLELIPEEDDR